MKKHNRSPRKNRRPPLQRSNAAIAKAVFRALNQVKWRRATDRELGRHLGLDHRTIGRWKKRLAGGEVPQAVITKKWLLFACERIATIIPDAVWRELDENGLASVRKAYAALHRVLYGGKTLPDWTLTRKAAVKEEPCK